jgi:uncharacterized membrane protein
MSRRSRLGSLLELIGADLLTYGATGHHVHEALGLTRDHARRREGTRIPQQLGARVRRSIHVNAPPERAYECVRDLENLPFYEARDEKRSHWVVKAPAGTEMEWDAEIINDLPGELMAWRSVNNPEVESAGSVHFESGPRQRDTRRCEDAIFAGCGCAGRDGGRALWRRTGSAVEG